jgi:hypothetical protein
MGCGVDPLIIIKATKIVGITCKLTALLKHHTSSLYRLMFLERYFLHTTAMISADLTTYAHGINETY